MLTAEGLGVLGFSFLKVVGSDEKVSYVLLQLILHLAPQEATVNGTLCDVHLTKLHCVVLSQDSRVCNPNEIE